MSFLSRSVTSLWTLRPTASLPFSATACVARTYSSTALRSPFRDLGVTRPVASALQDAFPNIQAPTSTQAEFIPAVLDGKDILLKDKTGSGKSIGLLIALLSKDRPSVKNWLEDEGYTYQKPRITSLIITPHRDLAFQYLHWAKCMHTTDHLGRGKLERIMQVIVRGADTPIAKQVQRAADEPPNILVATPQALLEALSLQSPPLSLRGLKTVVVDEADYLLESLPAKNDKYSMLKFARMTAKHPTPTRQILDAIYKVQRVLEWRKQRMAQAETVNADRVVLATLASGIVKAHLPVNRPQLVFASATLKARFRHSLYADGKWLTPDEERQAKVLAAGTVKKEDRVASTVGSPSIVHSALIVSPDGDVLNIKGAVDPFPNPPASTSEPDPDGPRVADEDPPLEDAVRPELESEQEFKGPSPFSPAALEAIATVFALEVPRVALLVLHPSAPVARAVHEMRALGVNARGLDVLDQDRGGSYLLRTGTVPADTPTLLVSTLAAVRGLDLPDLTHVFVMGARAMDALNHDSYAHAAGRVGRFGKSGKVITVVDKRYSVKHGKKAVWVDEPMKLKQVYMRLHITPVQVEHFGTAGKSEDTTSDREGPEDEDLDDADRGA